MKDDLPMKFGLLLIFSLLCLFVTPAFAAVHDQERVASAIFLWQLVNEARTHPLETIQSLGIDEGAARQALGDDAGLLDTGLPPLAWDNLLSMASMGHNLEMVNQLYYSSTALDGSLPADRIAVAGYQACQAGELLGAMAFSVYMAPEEAARLVFAGWLRDELDPSRIGPRHIFSRDYSEVGYSFVGAVLKISDAPPNVYVVVADFARPVVPRFFLLGTVYADANGDGCWSAGEGLPGIRFSCWVDGWPGEYGYTSGIGGVYQLPLVDGAYTIKLSDEQAAAAVYRLNAIGPLRENRLADLCLR
jgi:hypothetical protein